MYVLNLLIMFQLFSFLVCVSAYYTGSHMSDVRSFSAEEGN